MEAPEREKEDGLRLRPVPPRCRRMMAVAGAEWKAWKRAVVVGECDWEGVGELVEEVELYFRWCRYESASLIL